MGGGSKKKKDGMPSLREILINGETYRGEFAGAADIYHPRPSSDHCAHWLTDTRRSWATQGSPLGSLDPNNRSEILLVGGCTQAQAGDHPTQAQASEHPTQAQHSWPAALTSPRHTHAQWATACSWCRLRTLRKTT